MSYVVHIFSLVSYFPLLLSDAEKMTSFKKDLSLFVTAYAWYAKFTDAEVYPGVRTRLDFYNNVFYKRVMRCYHVIS